MKYTKVKNVKSPCRANTTDAGIDFFVPDDLTKTELDRKPHDGAEFFCINGFMDHIRLDPGGRCLIPSGIHVRLEPGTALLLVNKSGVAANKGLTVGSCLVDETYTGEVHLSIINTTAHSVRIEPGDKIVQGIILNVSHSMPEEFASEEDLYKDFETTRGAGGFGSSGTK